jgi:alcohol dehydrogenase YqhD (iron-dependent ADH family)
MLFEFQIIGKQAVNYTVNTAYPTFKNVEECAAIARRVGVNCIVTIGSGSIADVGKGTRSLLESGIKNFNELDNIFAKESKPLESKLPLFSVSTTISPVPLSPSWAYLHHEDDLLIKRQCKEPDSIVFDYNIISKSSSYSDLASGGYFWSHLFDSIFSYSLYSLNKGIDESIVEKNCEDLLKSDKHSQLISNISNLLERRHVDSNNTCGISKPDNDLLSK